MGSFLFKLLYPDWAPNSLISSGILPWFAPRSLHRVVAPVQPLDLHACSVMAVPGLLSTHSLILSLLLLHSHSLLRAIPTELLLCTVASRLEFPVRFFRGLPSRTLPYQYNVLCVELCVRLKLRHDLLGHLHLYILTRLPLMTHLLLLPCSLASYPSWIASSVSSAWCGSAAQRANTALGTRLVFHRHTLPGGSVTAVSGS